MKLFNKILFFFIFVISLQTILTTIFFTNIVKRNNTKELQDQLQKDANELKNNFFSWKRLIWKMLIESAQDEEISNNILNQASDHAINILMQLLKTKYEQSPISCIGIKYNNSLLDIQEIQNNKINYSDLYQLNYHFNRVYPYENNDHPYIELKLINSKIYIIGSIRLVVTPSDFFDLFFIKVIDQQYNNYFSLNKKSIFTFHSEDEYILGNSSEELTNELTSILQKTQQHNIYNQITNIKIKNTHYLFEIHNMHFILHHDHRSNLKLLTLISTEESEKRLLKITRVVLYVSFFSAVFSLILSFFLSTNITKPIKQLVSAMHNIKNGIFNVKID
ncbi:MAG: hypothetical protein MJB14_08015, partial [Spirochaetes bacterium]|nr:hypothetical protein [Spirochaetota bacterium]